MTQQEKERHAYEEGLSLAKRVLSGKLGATRDIPPNGEHYFEWAAATARFLGVPAEEVVSSVRAFHDERVEAAPDPALYPEARGERDVLLKHYQGMRDAGFSDDLVALHESLQFWQKHRMPQLYNKVCNPTVVDRLRERCRIVYVPESDQGPIHFKNVDDPLTYWTPKPPPKQGAPWPFAPLFFDGVGSGLHVDEPPKEIFPLDPKALCREHCATVDEAKDFLVRYGYFWDSANLLIHDEHGRSVALDKALRNHVAVREPDSSGISYVNGMSSFEPDYQTRIDKQREIYLRETRQDEDSIEGRFFRYTRQVRDNMEAYMDQLKESPTLSKVIAIMTSRDEDGPLCKYGHKVHPDETNPGYTLCQNLYFLNSRLQFRRQWRGETPVWEDPWESIQYV